MRTSFAIVALTILLVGDAAAQSAGRGNDDSSRRAADEAAARAAAQQQQQQQRVVQSLLAIDPARLQTIGLWPEKAAVPCKLPKRAEPYECHRVLVGPAILLTPLRAEIIVAKSDAALARGERSWWRFSVDPAAPPLAIGRDEVLYFVGEPNFALYGERGDVVVTIYRP